ncbi:MAG: hypothetical protein AB7S26_21120 [Sandaracinaceae bacterium]
MARLSFVALLALGLAACAADGRPSGRTDGGGLGYDAGGFGGGPDAQGCVPSQEGTPETCSDGLDNNCNGRYDCSDVLCSGVGACPICGEVNNQLGAPLALPDGVGDIECASDSDCPGGQRCFEIEGFLGTTQECRESYRSTLNFIGFGGATFDSVNDITALCVTMEHSWLRDLEITLEAPNGSRVRLQRFLGQMGEEIYLGGANDCDDDGTPVPGMGQRYCWTPTATRQSMLDYANGGGALDSVMDCNGGSSDMMPAGDYSAADDWSQLIGSPLNGTWTLSVTDLWPIDNGYIFEWTISFDPNAVADCSSPLI